MHATSYRFETLWRVQAPPEEVTEILSDAAALSRWWPQVYLEVRQPEPGVYSFKTRGWLPYALRWNARVVESHAPLGFSIAAWGDLEGTGCWTFTRDGAFTNIRYLWSVRANKPLLRWFSLLLKPLFEANHRWAMARGEESLISELARRRAARYVLPGTVL